MLLKVIAVAACFTMGFSPQNAELIVHHSVNGFYDARYDANGDGVEDIMDAIKVMKRYHNNVDNNATITLDSNNIYELLNTETDEEVFYWEIDKIGDTPCRKYEYTATKEIRIHIYYETENECSGFQVVMNPFEELIYTD